MLTQEIIDNAILKIKGMESSLAWELMKEEEYGGNISCCMFRLGLLWLWRRALSCQVVEVNAEGVIELSIAGVSHPSNVQVLVDGTSISGLCTLNSTSVSAWLNFIVGKINTYQSNYIATYDSVSGKVYIKGPTSAAFGLQVTTTWPYLTFIVTNASSGVSKSGCLSDTETKSLIGKINGLCQ